MTLLRVVRKIAMPVQFDDRTIEYIVRDATMGDKPLTGRTNPQTWQLWKEGYVVLKNFIPKDIVNFTLDAWKVIELDPENANAYINRGFSKHNLEDYKGAIEDYTKAIELDPNDALA